MSDEPQVPDDLSALFHGAAPEALPFLESIRAGVTDAHQRGLLQGFELSRAALEATGRAIGDLPGFDGQARVMAQLTVQGCVKAIEELIKEFDRHEHARKGLT